MGRRAAFLDRDGVIIVDSGYVWRPEHIQLVDGAIEMLRAFAADGFALIVVTNQSGIGRGYYTEADFAAVTAHIDRLLLARGVAIEATYHCPHLPSARCACRKPKPGMLLRAAAEHDLDLDESIMVGDRESDVLAGVAAGVRCSMFSSSVIGLL